MDIETKHLRIHGRVQGVGYRDWAAFKARELRLMGWVRNVRHDKSVEVVIHGDQESIQKFISACYEGPSSAKVNAVQVGAAPDEDFKKFEILDTV